MSPDSAAPEIPQDQTDPKIIVASCSPWLTVAEAAKRIRVNVDFIYNACAIGGLQHCRLAGRRGIRILPEWVDEWMLRYMRKDG